MIEQVCNLIQSILQDQAQSDDAKSLQIRGTVRNQGSRRCSRYANDAANDLKLTASELRELLAELKRMEQTGAEQLAREAVRARANYEHYCACFAVNRAFVARWQICVAR